MPEEMTMDNSKSNPPSVVSGDTAASKTCLAAVWGTPAGSAPANTHTDTHHASQCQDSALFQEGRAPAVS